MPFLAQTSGSDRVVLLTMCRNRVDLCTSTVVPLTCQLPRSPRVLPMAG